MNWELMTQGWPATIDAFLEDTCVIFAVAFFLSRLHAADRNFFLGKTQKSLALSILFGFLASSEVVFPGMRQPYISHTLVICLATLVAGWRLALLSLVIVVVLTFAMAGRLAAAETTAVLLSVVAITATLDHFLTHRRQALFFALIGAASEAVALLVSNAIVPALHLRQFTPLLPGSVLANGFGMGLIMLVFEDSNAKALTQQQLLDLERLKTLSVQADLAALRARIRPHFLFNTLTALASLCNIDAQQTERSIVNLSRLMRRTLEEEATSTATISTEVDYVTAYSDIQTLRFGGIIGITFSIAPELLDTEVPAFAVQTLVENAYLHGFANRSGSGEILVTVRKVRNSALIAVKDSGAGVSSMPPHLAVDRTEFPKHGLGIIDKQLRLMFGAGARIRIFSSPGSGTLVTFRVPALIHETRESL